MARQCGSQALQARSACAVISGVLRSNGSVPQPRQNVGMPPSRFWTPSSQRAPAAAAATVARIRLAELPQRQQRAGRVVGVRHAAAQRRPRPGARRGVGERMLARRSADASSHCRIERRISRRAASPASASAPIDSVVTQVARFVSIGQLPSGRIDSSRNRTPRVDDRTVGPTRARQAHHDEAGQRRRLEVAAALRLHLAQHAMRLPAHARPAAVASRGLRDGARRWRTWPIAISAGSA